MIMLSCICKSPKKAKAKNDKNSPEISTGTVNAENDSIPVVEEWSHAIDHQTNLERIKLTESGSSEHGDNDLIQLNEELNHATDHQTNLGRTKSTEKEIAVIISQFWFRTIMMDQKMQISDIIGIVVDYIPWDHYNGKWIPENCGKGFRVIGNHELLFYDGAYISAKLDVPIPIDPDSKSGNIVYWKMIVTADGNNALALGLFEMFGVVSDRCDNIGKPAWGGLIDFYGIGCGDLVWDVGTSKKFPDKNEEYRAKAGPRGIQLGDVVMMGLNQRSSELTFSREGKELWKLQLPQRNAWFPCVALGFGQYQYRVKVVPLS